MTYRIGDSSTLFKDISVGQTFASKGSCELYLKVEKIVAERMPLKPFNAVNLERGTWTSFFDEEMITPLSGEFVITDID